MTTTHGQRCSRLVTKGVSHGGVSGERGLGWVLPLFCRHSDSLTPAPPLQNLLAGAKNASDVPFFIKTLLKKMREANLIKE